MKLIDQGDYFESFIWKDTESSVKRKKKTRGEMPPYISVFSTTKQNKFSNIAWKLVVMENLKYIQ